MAKEKRDCVFSSCHSKSCYFWAISRGHTLNVLFFSGSLGMSFWSLLQKLQELWEDGKTGRSEAECEYRCDLGLKEGKPCVLAQREKLWSCLGSWWLSRGLVTLPSHMEALNVRKTCSPWLWDGQKRKAMPAHVLNVHLHWHQHLYTTHLPSEITSCRLRVWLGKLRFAFKPLILILFFVETPCWVGG